MLEQARVADDLAVLEPTNEPSGRVASSRSHSSSVERDVPRQRHVRVALECDRPCARSSSSRRPARGTISMPSGNRRASRRRSRGSARADSRRPLAGSARRSNRLRLVGVDEGDQLLPPEAANMVGEREQERGPDATSTEVGQHTRGDEAAAREVRAGSDAAADQVRRRARRGGEPALLVGRSDLLGRDRLVRDDRVLERCPCVEIGAGYDHRSDGATPIVCTSAATTTRPPRETLAQRGAVSASTHFAWCLPRPVLVDLAASSSRAARGACSGGSARGRGGRRGARPRGT